eukprot:scaffold75592_cov17-Prasinocladus_malaysianus.AAC.1
MVASLAMRIVVELQRTTADVCIFVELHLRIVVMTAGTTELTCTLKHILSRTKAAGNENAGKIKCDALQRNHLFHETTNKAIHMQHRSART